jgi:hypothetical protein
LPDRRLYEEDFWQALSISPVISLFASCFLKLLHENLNLSGLKVGGAGNGGLGCLCLWLVLVSG